LTYGITVAGKAEVSEDFTSISVMLDQAYLLAFQQKHVLKVRRKGRRRGSLLGYSRLKTVITEGVPFYKIANTDVTISSMKILFYKTRVL